MKRYDPRMHCPRSMPRHPVVSWGAAAERLGVSKAHLWLVANGKRRSARLLTAYKALLSKLSAK